MAPEIVTPNLVDVGEGRRLNMVCTGTGSPTVVFEQGGEGNILNWQKVQPAITALTRTCFYDRAGFGYSDPPSRSVTGLSVTDDLHILLRKVGVELPIVIVGHSVGGFYATLYADRFPSDVAGMVLVEPGFSGQFHPSTETESVYEHANMVRGDDGERECAVLASEGKVTTNSPPCFTMAAGHPKLDAEYLVHGFTRPAWFEAEISQSKNYFGNGLEDSEDSREERTFSSSFGSMPLVVLSAGTVARDSWLGDAAYEEFQQRWRKGHANLAKRSTRGEWLVIPNSTHFIQKDQPQAVIDAITKVISEFRLGRPTLEPISK